MANSITIQLRPTKSYSVPSVANLLHNTGLAKATYWIKNPHSLISNLDIKNLTTRGAVDLWRKWEEKAVNLVLKNKKRNPQKKQVLVEEGLMVIGKDVLENNPKTFIQIFLEFKKWFEEKYKTKVLAYFFHQHEGHIDENGNFLSNLHIHFFFLNVNKKGESVRRQIKKTDLSYFQTKIHQIGQKYIPTLKRATNYAELQLKAPKHKSHRQLRAEKNKETQLKLVPELKKAKKENKELLAKVRDLKEENKRTREQFREFGAKRGDYAKLEQLNKELKEKIKKKELTLEEMKRAFETELNTLKEKLQQKEEENKSLKSLKSKIKELKEQAEELKKEVKELKEFVNTYTLTIKHNTTTRDKTLYLDLNEYSYKEISEDVFKVRFSWGYAIDDAKNNIIKIKLFISKNDQESIYKAVEDIYQLLKDKEIDLSNTNIQIESDNEELKEEIKFKLFLSNRKRNKNNLGNSVKNKM